MSKLSKTLWMAAGAALGAGVTYYALKKDEVDFEGLASDLVKSAKEFGEELAGDFETHFNKDENPSPKTSYDIVSSIPTILTNLDPYTPND